MNDKPLAHPAWAELRHGGLLIAPAHLRAFFDGEARPLRDDLLEQLRRAASRFEAREQNAESAWLDLVLRRALGLGQPTDPESGHWLGGNDVGAEWTRRSVTGEALKPRRVWRGAHGATLPLFWSDEKRIGVGRGRRAPTRVVEWLRQRGDRLALLTNGSQWRLVHASLDHEAWVESDRERWFEEGAEGLQLLALRVLLSPVTLAPAAEGATPRLQAAIEASRRSQAELSSELGERVRRAVERLIHEHGPALTELLARDSSVTSKDVYRAATRIVMRMVVVLFAEARDLLPRSEELYLGSYGLAALREQLERAGAGGQVGSVRAERLKHRFGAWPRVLALFRLVYAGSGHPALKVPQYGGELFAAGEADANEPLARALHVFESASLTRGQIMPDLAVYDVLRLLTRSRVRVRAGRSAAWVEGPVDFGDLSSEYIGILYEGLLDYELRCAREDDPVVFLAVGDEPALPLSRLEPMDDGDIAELVKKAGKKSKLIVGEAEDGSEEEEDDDEESDDPDQDQDEQDQDDQGDGAAHPVEPNQPPELDEPDDARETARQRVLEWARRAVVAGKLVPKPRTRKADALRANQAAVEAAAGGLIARVVLPGEWFLVRFGGTRKGSGTFYTRPQLAVPTVHRTLRPLAFDPPVGAGGKADEDTPAAAWTPKPPDTILALRVCDPACGSGSFPVAALRFLTESLHASLLHHRWVVERDGRLVLGTVADPRPQWLDECLRDALTTTDDAEELLKRRLRRIVVERCLYGVDLDPLAVELAKLALWVETLDRELPFTFLDHKIRCGNSLVGCWFDRVRDFPALAWEREGGDKGHTRGTHYQKEQWTKAIKAQRKRVQQDLAAHLQRIMSAQITLPGMLAAGAAEAAHDEALRVFERLHALPLHDSAERARVFRESFRESEAVRALREAMDLWCAQWFWPADEAVHAPLPSQSASPSEETRWIAHELARDLRFFHWELEFPDVFLGKGAGFDAVLGNPPWETLQPVSKEYFSNLDPLYRAYGKQHGLDRQAEIFAASPSDERDWLEYVARFKAYANFMAFAAAPFGDPAEGEKFSLGAGGDALHADWRSRRSKQSGYADASHPYRDQGEGKPYTYKLFLEQAHALLKPDGLMGFVVPSGLYTDKGTADLRRLFLERCRWRWLFGFENRDKVFDIDSRFKFGPVIVQKGGRTDAVRTAFMRRELKDWEDAERHAIPYAFAQVQRFSPRTRAILEIRHPRDLEILEKVYANGVLLGDESEDGWRIKYSQGDFNMTSDSDKFKPRPWWEERGYRPDAYSRWLRFEPSKVVQDAARFLSPGWIPLEGGGYVHEASVQDVALPLYEGRMIGQFDFSQKGWVSGKGRGAVWREIPWEGKRVEPQYLMDQQTARDSMGIGSVQSKATIMDIGSATNERTAYATMLARVPCGHSAPVLRAQEASAVSTAALVVLLNSIAFDALLRVRLGGLHLSWNYLEETVLPPLCSSVLLDHLSAMGLRLSASHPSFAPAWSRFDAHSGPWRRLWAITRHERLRLRAMLDAIAAELFGLEWEDFAWILRECDHPLPRMSEKAFKRELDPKGFWRVDQGRDPELRHTVLSLVAFSDLKQIIALHGDRDKGIEAFCAQNDGDGWMLPEVLRLADLGLGHDERACQAQPVSEPMGERFLPWQLSQSVEESWAECAWHARNVLGEQAYERLQRKLRGEEVEELSMVAEGGPPDYPGLPGGQKRPVPPAQSDLFGGKSEVLPVRKGRRPRK